MKRIITSILILALALSLAACGQTPAPTTPATEPAPTTAPTTVPTEPAPTEPEWVTGIVRADGVGILHTVFQKEDAVTVLGQWENYYIVEGQEADLLVSMDLLRLDEEQAPKASAGYAKSKTKVYATAYLTGESLKTLKLNTKVQVLDTKGDWAYIQWGDSTGYVAKSQISAKKIATGGGGGGGGTQDGTDVDIGGLSNSQAPAGGVLLLGSYSGPVYEQYAQAKPGKILSPETQGYLNTPGRDEEVKVTQVTEDTCTLWTGEAYGTVPRWAVRLQDDADYETWSAYAKKSKAYGEYTLDTQVKSFKKNERVDVVDCIEEMELYVLRVDDAYAYIATDKLSKKKIATGGGGGGGSDSGWTPPVL